MKLNDKFHVIHFPGAIRYWKHPSRVANYDPGTAALILERVGRIEATPAIPAIFLPLQGILKAPPDQVNLDKVVELVSYGNTIAAQMLARR